MNNTLTRIDEYSVAFTFPPKEIQFALESCFFFLFKPNVMNSFCLCVLAGCQCNILTTLVSQCFWIAESLGCPQGLIDSKHTDIC